MSKPMALTRPMLSERLTNILCHLGSFVLARFCSSSFKLDPYLHAKMTGQVHEFAAVDDAAGALFIELAVDQDPDAREVGVRHEELRLEGRPQRQTGRRHVHDRLGEP